MEYPLGVHERQNAHSKTGKTANEITLIGVLNGKIAAEDIKVSKETLNAQSKVALKNGLRELGQNFERASELVNVPDSVILELYNRLRPNRCTKNELLETARMLETKYGAKNCAALFREAAEVYERRGVCENSSRR